ncbi:hypothetical protein QQP08_023562 [Theobroma cacao]|nr:hypothetical protein QQP08_023562 [Theobroma cacao]
MVPHIFGETDEEYSNRDEGSSGGNKGSAATKARGATVTVVAYNGLNEEARNRATKPNESSPGVGDTEGLDGELQRPSELDAGGDGCNGDDLPKRAWRLDDISVFHLVGNYTLPVNCKLYSLV